MDPGTPGTLGPKDPTSRTLGPLDARILGPLKPWTLRPLRRRIFSDFQSYRAENKFINVFFRVEFDFDVRSVIAPQKLG